MGKGDLDRMEECFFIEQIASDLRQDEGFSQYPYLDTEGHLTVGYGRNLDAKGISNAEADMLLRNDIIASQHALAQVLPVSSKLGKTRYRVLINMMFNLGINGFMSFRKMRQAIFKQDFNRAADEMLDSKWAMQVGDRAIRLADMMRTGHDPRGRY